jgi:hypothetical protein
MELCIRKSLLAAGKYSVRFIQDFRDQPFINGIIKTGPSGPGIIIKERTPGTQIESGGVAIES